MGFFSQIEGPVKDVIETLLADEQISEDLTYYKFAGQAFDEAEGHNVDSFEEVSVRASRLRHSIKSATVATGGVQAGDMFFMFAFDDLPEDISIKDRIVDASGNEFKIRGIDKVFGLAISMTVDGV